MLRAQETSEGTVEGNAQYTDNNDQAMTVNEPILTYVREYYYMKTHCISIHVSLLVKNMTQ